MKGYLAMAALPILLVAMLMLCSEVTCVVGEKARKDKHSPLSDKAVKTVVQALQDVGGFSTVALLMPYLAPLMLKRTTLLIPSDEAVRRGMPTWHPLRKEGDKTPFNFFTSEELISLAKYHMIKSANLSFSDLLKLPAGTLLPTVLGIAHRLEIMRSLPHDYTINNAHIVHQDLCPHFISSFVTCHGIDSLLLGGLALNSTNSNSPHPPSPSLPPISHDNSSYPHDYYPSYPPTFNYSSPNPSSYNYSSPYSPSSNYSSPYPSVYNYSSSYPPTNDSLPPLVAPFPSNNTIEPSPSTTNQTSPSPAPSPSPPTSNGVIAQLSVMPVLAIVFITLLAF